MPSFILESQRLLLKPPAMGDVPAIVGMIGDWDVAKNLARVPHPYTEQDGIAYVARQEDARTKGTDFTFAVTRKSDGAFLGKCGIHLQESGFELGYWFGRPYWGQGYATEAAAEVLALAFRNLRAEQVYAGWFHDNPGSGRVLEKLGFRHDGITQHECLSRGHAVLCNQMTMRRAEHGQRYAA